MSIERVRAYFRNMNLEERVWEFDTSSATVELAAQTLQVRPARIAKTLSFALGEGCVLVVAAGDARVDNRKFKDQFATKAKMLSPEEVERFTGCEIGGVCPFDLPETTPVYLDVSLKRFVTVFPACGSTNSAMEVTCDELHRYSRAAG
ncbi:MAG: YbaK/EbsC family protein, partial [Eubacteriales bacterium]